MSLVKDYLMTNIVFKLYNQFNSSFFDLIEGDDETKQTKGLGVVLSKSPLFLKAFLSLRKIKSNIRLSPIDEYSSVVVNCELIDSVEKKRIDILIRFYKANKLEKAIIIEAKTLRKAVCFSSAKIQLDAYVDKYFSQIFKDLDCQSILKVVLTKYSNVETGENTISLAWDEILELLYRIKPKVDDFETHLCRDYFVFLSKISGAMKFYEKEVFSIPSAEWSQKLIEECSLYECLNSGRYVIKKKPLYLAFRKSGGGEMDRLYKIMDIVVLRPKDDLDLFLDSDYDESLKENLRKYCDFMTKHENGHWKNGLPSDERQFIMLSKDDSIELKSPYPKPVRNNSFRAYYTLSEILNNTIGVGEIEEE